jgi:hypothetical protein
MPRRPRQDRIVVPETREPVAVAEADVSLLDVIDHVLNQGIVLSGELMLGIADVDLISIRLLALISSADRASGAAPTSKPRRQRQRRRR